MKGEGEDATRSFPKKNRLVGSREGKGFWVASIGREKKRGSNQTLCIE